MSCFTLGFLQQLIVWCIVTAALVACLQLLIPWLSSFTWPILGQVLRIILWAIVAIIVVYIIFALLSCLLGGAGGAPFRLPR